MASGKQIAEENFDKFTRWVASKVDDEFRQMVNRDGVLSRKEIATQCGIGLSAINQNPRIKGALLAAERELRDRGVLPPLAVKAESVGDATTPSILLVPQSKSLDAQRVGRLELENASLKAENGELKRQLAQFIILREALAMTGRLPR